MDPHTLFNGYENTEWIIVKTYEEFTEFIYKNGLPSCISFDHDLHDEHYGDLDIDYNKYKYKTGYECVEWLICYLELTNATNIPELRVHSMNPVGRENIRNLFKVNGLRVWDFPTYFFNFLIKIVYI